MKITWLGDPGDASQVKTEQFGLRFAKGEATNVSDKLDPKLIAKFHGNSSFKVEGAPEIVRGPAETDEQFNWRLNAAKYNEHPIKLPPPGAEPAPFPNEDEKVYKARLAAWQAEVAAFNKQRDAL